MSEAPLRVIFAGTPEFAALHLRALIDSEHQLLAVYTQPDRPAGRGKKLQASPVKRLAEGAGLPVYQPASLRDVAEQQRLAELAADVLIVVAYGLILPQAVLDAPRLGCLNVHASLLPRWRGAAPAATTDETAAASAPAAHPTDSRDPDPSRADTTRPTKGAHDTDREREPQTMTTGAPMAATR